MQTFWPHGIATDDSLSAVDHGFYDLRPRGKRAAAILFASQYRSAVTPAQRGRGAATPPVSGADPTKPSTPRHVAMIWARRLKRVFGVKIECWARCGGQLQIIASIEEPQLIAKILSHLERAAPEQYQRELRLRKRGPAL